MNSSGFPRLPPPTERTCARCGLRKPASEYRLDAAGRLRSWCIPCSAEATREWRRANPDEWNAYRRRRYRALRDAGLSRAEANLRK